MKKIKFILCTLFLITCMTVPVLADDDTETYSISIDYTNPNGYSQVFTDEDGNIIEIEISPVEEVPITRGTTTEELSNGTYTRTASVSFTEPACNETMKLSFKFKANISTTENPKLHNITNIVRTNIHTYTGPTIHRQYATSSLPAYIAASGTGNFTNSTARRLTIKVELSYSEILTITTSSSPIE